MEPVITVITCVYNCERYLKEAIESFLNQSYQNFEYIIIDDGSTDDTLDILWRYAAKDNRIIVIEKKHTGLTDSLNVGLRQAKGEWIARLDADDIALPDRLELQLNFVQKNDEVVLLGGGCIEIDENGTAIKRHIYPRKHEDLMSRLENEKALFPHSSAFFNKEYVMRLGGYNNRFLRSQDWDLWLRIGEGALISCLEIPVVKLRRHSQTISNTDQGRLQIIMGVCAMSCHFRRKWGLSDPSQSDEKTWKEFQGWVEKRMETEGLFRLMQGWRDFRSNWYRDGNVNKFKKYKSTLVKLIKNPLVQDVLWKRLRNDNIALKLAEESKKECAI